MKIITINSKKISSETIKPMVAEFKAGKIVVCPTDTIFGFSCLSSVRLAINKIERIKGRAKSKSFIILVSSYAMAKTLVYLSVDQQKQWAKLAKEKPTTIILRSKLGQKTLALRLITDGLLFSVLKKLKQPIISTSVNFSGQSFKRTSVEILDFCKRLPIIKQPDLLVLSSSSGSDTPSRLVDLSGEGLIILRP